jgi:3-phenylpropionate/cinnamic acid dioxygenase small subunit
MDDRDAIANLMATYAEALDGARFDELGRIFAEATVTITGGPQDGSVATGEAEVADLYRSIVALDDQGRPGTRHFLTNFFIEVGDDGRAAVARSYFAVTQQTRTLPLQVVACGAYHDDYVLGEDGWAFARRRIICDQVGDLDEHML